MLDVSLMYPLLSLAYFVTTVLAVLVLNEPVRTSRWVGVALIVIGSILVGMNKSTQHFLSLDIESLTASSESLAVVVSIEQTYRLRDFLELWGAKYEALTILKGPICSTESKRPFSSSSDTVAHRPHPLGTPPTPSPPRLHARGLIAQ